MSVFLDIESHLDCVFSPTASLQLQVHSCLDTDTVCVYMYMFIPSSNTMYRQAYTYVGIQGLFCFTGCIPAVFAFAGSKGEREGYYQISHLNKKEHRKIHSLLFFCNNKPEI